MIVNTARLARLVWWAFCTALTIALLVIVGLGSWWVYRTTGSAHKNGDLVHRTNLDKGGVVELRGCMAGDNKIDLMENRQERYLRHCDVVTTRTLWKTIPVGLWHEGIRVGDQVTVRIDRYPREWFKSLCIGKECMPLDRCQDWMPCWKETMPSPTPRAVPAASSVEAESP